LHAAHLILPSPVSQAEETDKNALAELVGIMAFLSSKGANGKMVEFLPLTGQIPFGRIT